MATQKSRGYERIAKERDEARAELAALRQRVAELEAAQAIVTPNNFRHCQRAAEQMRENAAQCVYNNFDGPKWIAILLLNKIRALPLPECDGCNPLKPE